MLKSVILFIIVFVSQLSASVLSQEKLSVNLKDATIKEVIDDIQSQTSYGFVYNINEISKMEAITISMKNVSLEKLLNKVFENSSLTYRVENKIIVIKPKQQLEQQDSRRTIKGKVVDEKGEPMPGVTVLISGTIIGVATDQHGRYQIKVKDTDVLKFSFIGYKTKIVLVNNKEKINIALEPNVQTLEETTVVAYGEQKKESVVSAITSIKPGVLKSSNSDLTASFAGNIAGVIGWQTGGMPGAMTEDEMNTKFYIRGIISFQTDANIDPLILMDGIEISKLDLSRIDPDDIESFNVLKDASATAMYGARGANGVIYVKTKKGKSGNVYTTLRCELIMSQPTKDIDVVGPKDYMRLYNEALTGRIEGMTPRYSEEKITNTNSDRFPYFVYPGNDWYSMLFKDYNVNKHYALNVRGGTERMQYYASVTLNDDKGMIKADKINQFDPNIDTKQFTFRTNLNVNLSSTGKLNITSFSTYDKYVGPYTGKGTDAQRAIYYLAFHANPVDFAAVYPDDGEHSWPHIRFGGGYSYNPYAELQQGYKNRTRFSTINQAEYIQKLNFITKGLEARLSISYSQSGYSTTGYCTVPSAYSLDDYNYATGAFKLKLWNKESASRLLYYKEEDDSKTSTVQTEYKATLLHTRAWGNHSTSVTGVFSAQEKRNNYSDEEVLASLPERNLGLALRTSYGYKSTYFLEASAGYNGSERFSKKHKMGLFPSIGCAWVASHEKFFKKFPWLTYLKFRTSYGQVGNDGVIKDPRFVYMQTIEGPLKSSVKRGADGYSYYYKYDVSSYGNDETTWEIAEQTNFGMEIKLWGGLIDMDFDFYQDIRHNIYSYRNALPSSMGLEADIMSMQVPRSHIDTCFNRVVHLLDEAIPYLDDIDSHDTHRKQTMCKEAAYALRARARLYQASPLFNGNSWYSQFTNRDGEPLFTSEYDASKWKNAADAAKEALDVCIQNGRKLEKDYQVKKTSLLNKMYDINASTLSPGFVGSEWLWLYQSNEPDARNGALLPRNTYNGSSTAILGNVNPSMRMIEMFYTENGLPIDKDKTWAYSQRYSLMKEYDPKYDGVVALKTNIPGVNLKREPRFYADLIFDKSYFAYSYTFLVNAKKGEQYGNTFNYSQADNIQNMTGYWCKKLTPYNVSEYYPKYSLTPFPIFRLAELYLNYAEALNEYSGPSQEVYDAIDMIRDRAGILPVVKAWKEYSTEPNKVTTKEGMRDIIHRERTIEFAFEGYRYWDLRRWKEAEVLNEDRYGWNTFGDTEESYYNYGRGPIVVWSENKFESPRDYFFPIRSDETVTANIKQNLYW